MALPLFLQNRPEWTNHDIKPPFVDGRPFPSNLSGRQIPHDGRKASSLMALRVDDVFLTSFEQALLFVAEVDALQQSISFLEQFLMLFREAPTCAPTAPYKQCGSHGMHRDTR